MINSYIGNIGIDHNIDLSYMGHINGGNINNKYDFSYMIQSNTGNNVIDQSVNTISYFAQRVNDKFIDLEPIILNVEFGGEDSYSKFNTTQICQKIGEAINTKNPNVFVKWENANGYFLAPVSINTYGTNAYVTVHGHPLLIVTDSDDDNSIIGVQYYSNNSFPSANKLFNSYRIIRGTMNDWINF